MGDSLRISPQKIVQSNLIHLKIPPSKSHTMRALLLGALLPKESRIHHFLSSPDTDRLLKSLQLLGAKIATSSEEISICGEFPWKSVDEPLDVGNSGIQLRFLTALASLSPQRYLIQGDPSLTLMRPVHDLLQGLAQLGATYTYLHEAGKAPFTIQGPIHSGKVFLQGRDSQPISALLFALSFLPSGGEIEVEDPQEIPWIKMTLRWLTRLGAEIEVSSDFKIYKIKRGIQKSSFDFSIPSDYSSLAYPFSMSLITQTPVTMSDFEEVHDEGDAAFLRHLKEDLGGDFHFNDGKLIPSLDWHWKTTSIDLSDCIDLTSLFTVLATKAHLPIQIRGIKGAKNKECDRLLAISRELQKMNGSVQVQKDTLLIEPTSLKGARVDSWGDHRMVFALSVAAMMAEGVTVIENARCILKSYPRYVEEMQQLGFDWEWV